MSVVKVLQADWKTLSAEQQNQLEGVFWQTASNTEFPDESSRQRFFDRWLGRYLKNDAIGFLFVAQLDGQVVGYCTGTVDSGVFFGRQVPLMEQMFSEHWRRYPAHLHINMSAACRGAGTGSALISAAKQHLHEQQTSGVYIITSPDSRNVSFYEGNGFNHRVRGEINAHPLLFMGCLLT